MATARSRVQLGALQLRPELNGRLGLALRFIDSKRRWEVQLDDEAGTLLLKAENLQFLAQLPSTGIAAPPPGSKICISAIAGCGLGVVATNVLKPGELVLAEKPLFMISAQEMMLARSQGRAAEEAMVQGKVSQLDVASQDCFWALCDCHTGNCEKTAFGIWHTNAIATGEDSAGTQNGLYLVGCRFNHSCKPNVNRCWIPERQAEVFHAIQDIAPGEELCIYYVDPTNVRSVRQESLRKAFNFTCRCEACSLEGAAQETSDHRRREYQRLDKLIRFDGRQDVQVLLDAVLERAELIQDEFDGDPHLLQRAFHDGFQLSLIAGDLETAGVWMERAFEAKVLAEGCHKQALKLKTWAENPSLHPLAQQTGVGRAGRDSEEMPTVFCQPCGMSPPPPPPEEVDDQARSSDSETEAASLDLSTMD